VIATSEKELDEGQDESLVDIGQNVRRYSSAKIRKYTYSKSAMNKKTLNSRQRRQKCFRKVADSVDGINHNENQPPADMSYLYM